MELQGSGSPEKAKKAIKAKRAVKHNTKRQKELSREAKKGRKKEELQMQWSSRLRVPRKGKQKQ